MVHRGPGLPSAVQLMPNLQLLYGVASVVSISLSPMVANIVRDLRVGFCNAVE